MALSVLALALSLAALELGLRWKAGRREVVEGVEQEVRDRGLRFNHPTRGWANPPDARWVSQSPEFLVTMETNSRGLRDVEHERAAAPGAYRIAVLGDSFMEGAEVELEETMARRLEGELADRGVEVINFGVCAYGTAQELLMLEQVALEYEPDLVVLAMYVGNDVRNNVRELEVNARGRLLPFGVRRPYASLDASTGELAWSFPGDARLPPPAEAEGVAALPRRLLIVRRLLRWVNPPPPPEPVPTDANLFVGPYALTFDPSLGFAGFTEEDYRRLFDQAWRLTLRLVLAIHERTERAGAELIVLAIPAPYVVDDEQRAARELGSIELDPAGPSRRLARLAEQNGLHLLDLREPLRAAYERGEGPFYFEIDRHWNAAGHRRAAELLAAFLVERELVAD